MSETKQETKQKETKEQLLENWIQLSSEHGYEGAAAVLINSKNKILFLLSEKDGKLQCEMPGGKIEKEDNGDSKVTAIREMFEETGIQIQQDQIFKELKTTGGTTGYPSIQYLTTVSELQVPTKLESKFTGYLWAKITKVNEKEWFVVDENGLQIPLRRFNTFFLNQNFEELKDYIV